MCHRDDRGHDGGVLGITSEGRIVLSLPGSENAVRLGLEGILMNELKHLLWELRRYA